MELKRHNRISRSIAVIAFLCCAWAQGEVPRIGRIGDPSGGFDALQDVLRYSSVQDSLELRSEQHAEFQRLSSEYNAATRRVTGTWRELPADERTAERLTRELRTVRAALLPGIEQALDETQFTRLQQLQLQLRIRRGLFAPLYSKDVASELQLSPDQLRAWKSVIGNERKVYRDMMSELHSKIPEALMGVLTPGQRQKYEEAVGESYSDASMLPKIDDQRSPGRGFPLMLDLVRYPGIRYELEIVDEQQEHISSLLSEYRSQERALTLQWRARDARSKRPPSRDEKGIEEEARRNEAAVAVRQKELAVLHKKTRELLDEILLPHQVDRLQQLVLQARAQSQSNFWLLTEVAAKAIELTPEQREQLRETFEVESAEVQEQSTRFYDEALERILAALTVEQRVRYKLLVGAPFTLATGK